MILPIEQIRCDPAVQPRDRLDQSVVHEYSELMQEGRSFPPLHVVATDGAFLLVDGHHRLEAAKLAGLKDISCSVHDGDRRGAILLSSSANTRHGLRRTIADKRKAVMNLLADAEWAGWSDHRIARYCGVSQPFVSAMRSNTRQLTDNVISEKTPENERITRQFITKHGTRALMRLARRPQPIAASSEAIPSDADSHAGETNENTAASTGMDEIARAKFIEIVGKLEHAIRGFDITSIPIDLDSDDELRAKLERLAQMIVSKVNLLADRIQHASGL